MDRAAAGGKFVLVCPDLDCLTCYFEKKNSNRCLVCSSLSSSQELSMAGGLVVLESQNRAANMCAVGAWCLQAEKADHWRAWWPPWMHGEEAD
jgi:hypothetical protein